MIRKSLIAALTWMAILVMIMLGLVLQSIKTLGGCPNA